MAFSLTTDAHKGPLIAVFRYTDLTRQDPKKSSQIEPHETSRRISLLAPPRNLNLFGVDFKQI
jgi:hypothetical protein